MTKTKNNLRAKIIGWVSIILALLIVVISPYPVFAALTVQDAIKQDAYAELNNIAYYIQAADACKDKIKVLAYDYEFETDYGFGIEDGASEAVGRILNLDFVYDSKDLLYDGALEAMTSKGYKDGKIYCKELPFSPISTLANIYELDPTDIICGNNNGDGLFTVYHGFSADYWSHEGAAENWPKTNNGATTDCRGAIKNIKYFQENNASVGGDMSYGEYHVGFKVNKNFSFATYFQNIIGANLSSIDNINDPNLYLGLSYQNLFTNFKTACGASLASEGDYNNAKESGADTSIYYQIYDTEDGKTKYYKMTHPDRETYANGSLTNDWSVKCETIGQQLGPDGVFAKGKKAVDRRAILSSCFTQSYDYYSKTLKGNIQQKINLIDRIAEDYTGTYYLLDGSEETGRIDLVSRAEALIKEKSDYWPRVTSSYVQYMETSAQNAGGGAALEQFVAVSRDFETILMGYEQSLIDGLGISDDDIINLDGALTNYKENVKKFKEEVVDKVNDIIDGLPDYLKNNNVQGYIDSVPDDVDLNATPCPLMDDTLANAADQIADITGGDIDFEEYTPLDRNEDDAMSGYIPSSTDPCYNAGVEGMSWILCPAINNMAGAVDGIDLLLKDWLSIDSSWMGTNSGTYTAWEYCRNIANIVLIIVLLVVIFSQLTGLGIDNYGIKKILPRLIAIAILVNLSFIICQLLADLSNILGTSLDKMFQSIGRTISGVTAGQVVSTIIAAIFGVIAGAGAAAGTAITIIGLVEGGGGTMLVISLVLVLLIALVAIMMFFLMLGARMIIIIIFSALSPIAFACYVLPNTQKWFKKWWDIYKTALVMYPICGALYGISYVIRGIVFSGEGVHLWMALIAVCAPFIPFLILPTLLKGALSALGAIGNSIMSLGNGLKRGISKGNDTLRNTAAYQQAQEFNRNKLAERRANRTISRLGKIESSGGKLTDSQRNRLFKARTIANESMMRNASENAGVTMIDQATATMRAKATREAQETKLWSDQLSRASSSDVEKAFIAGLANGNTAQASAAFNTLKDTGNLPKIHRILNNKDEKGNEIIPNLWKNMSSDMRLSLNQDMIKSGDVAMKTYAKRSFAADNQGSFAEFMAGRAQTLSTSSGDRTIGGVGEELAKIGSHALDGQDKDSVEFLANHMDGLINNAASNPETRGSIAKMIMSGATSTQSGEEKKRFAEMIAQYKASFNGDQAAYEKAISEAVSAAQLAKLDSSIYKALGSDVIRDDATGELRIGESHPDQVNRMLKGAIEEIKKDNNATLYAGMSNAVKEAINGAAAAPIPPAP